MNSAYNWKEPGAIDPSFDRQPESDFVGRVPAQNHQLVSLDSQNRNPRPKNDSLGHIDTTQLSPAHLGPSVMSTTTLTTSGEIPRPLNEQIEAELTVTSPKEGTGRRMLSGTKRAAQNRNAQKAFRQRREKYVKELEATAAEVPELHKTIEELRRENIQLRDYTLALQSRLIEMTPGVAPPEHH